MATATLALTTTVPPIIDKGQIVVRGTIAITGADYATGGLILPLNLENIPSRSLPKQVKVWGQAGFIYNYVAGATLALGKVQIRVNTGAAANAPLPEHTAVAIVAGVVSDVINFEGVFEFGQ